MFWQGNAKLSTHMKVHSQSNGSHMPESSDALFFVAWGETDLASGPFTPLSNFSKGAKIHKVKTTDGTRGSDPATLSLMQKLEGST